MEGNQQSSASADQILCEHDLTPSNPITQWKGVILATIIAKKWKANIKEKLDPEVDPEVDPELEYLKVAHSALIQQLNAFGIVLTLLAAVTSMSILQPPGTFTDKGHMQPSRLVACFLVFLSLSFLLACTGLISVVVGFATLFRPFFSPKPPSGTKELEKIVPAGQVSKDGIVYDDIPTLGKIILDNLLRVRHLIMYLALSLVFSMVAFVCGAFAILGPGKRNLFMAIGTMIASGVVLAVETGFTLAGPTHPPSWLRKCAMLLTRGPGERIQGSNDDQ